MTSLSWRFLFIVILTLVASLVALPPKFSVQLPVSLPLVGQNISYDLTLNQVSFAGISLPIGKPLKQGLDIQGGIQVVLAADTSGLSPEDVNVAMESVTQIIRRRVDLYGVNEPNVQSAKSGDQQRVIVELAGVKDPAEALQLVGTTADLQFMLVGQLTNSNPDPAATASALPEITPTLLTGKSLKRSTLQYNQQTGEPEVGLEFNEEGAKEFANVTKEHVGETLGIFLDGYPVTLPTINTPILDGRAVITGQFTPQEAKALSIQLNAGALPVPVRVVEQRIVGASLGQQSVMMSLKAGLVGVFLVMFFMVAYYGVRGVLASLALTIYAILTIAAYKLIGVTLTLPGIAGLLLTIGMAVDANILIFERIKEEIRDGRSMERAVELGFGKAWDSIKDANLATIAISLLLINPLDFDFLNRSGMTRGFGLTLLVGVLLSLFTGVVVTRTLLRLFMPTKNV